MLAELIEKMKHPDWSTRRAAMQEIRLLGSEAASAISVILDSLKDPDYLVQLEACRALKAMGSATADAIPPLIANLQRGSFPPIGRK